MAEKEAEDTVGKEAVETADTGAEETAGKEGQTAEAERDKTRSN